MKKTSLIFFIFCLMGSQSTILAQNQDKLRRADCFFGVHFDLHASEDITDAGKTLTPEMVDTFLTKVRPDFIQIDCKGHPGISSYPTKVGSHVRSFQKDPLKLWREVTEKNKVSLFMHYSGVMDAKVCADHPDWAIIQANGDTSKQKTSFFSPYLDQIMIPQLKELSADYHVDGAWVDGECWAVEPDYSAAAIKAWKERTGIQEVPRTRDDAYFSRYLEFTRALFRENMKKYVDAIHAFDPKFQITSNWAYSSMMPEPVGVDVDFLSGDVTPQNGVYRSAFEARCLAPQGKPWDLMAWGFSWNGGKMPMSCKSVVQLEQEAAEIMAMGGGVQFYYQQNRDLSLKPWLGPVLKELGDFCRARQPYCHKATAIPQVALLYPSKSYQHNSSAPFAGSTENLQAVLYALLDNQFPVEVLMEHTLSGRMNNYPVIVIPECDYLAPAMLSELRSYLQGGGNLLVIGTETAALFARELGLSSAEKTEEKAVFIEASGRIGSMLTRALSVKLSPESQVLSNFYAGSDFRDKTTQVASSMKSVGKGKITGIYFDAGSSYRNYKTFVIRDFIGAAVKAMNPTLKVEVNGSHLVHVVLNQLNGKTYLNLVNTSGEHTNDSAIGYDQVPALTNLTVQVKTQSRPSKIILQPEGSDLDFTWANGKFSVLIPRVELHSILEIIN